MTSHSVPKPAGYLLTRFMILRLLGLVYFVAFLALANQLKPLIGKDGLTPASLFLQRVQAAAGSQGRAFFELPSLFWLGHSDAFLITLAWVGAGLSFLVLLGWANGVLLFFLWALYLSFVHIGQDWYGYGWEIQLLETGFLAVFLVPLWDPRPFPKTPAPVHVIWLFRWLAFRIMVGAGLIKMRGDPCWRDLTCLQYHYETQPIPNPLSPYFHFMPLWFHKLGALYNHLVELVCPWLMVMGRRLRTLAGCLMALFQFILILSGNLSFLNWLTLIPILACFDDAFWGRLLPKILVEKALSSAGESKPSPLHQKVAWVLTGLVFLLSLNPVFNLISPGQVMNTSFDRLHLVNTYGAFGSVGRERLQLVVEGATDAVPTKETVWKAYDFKCQPGDLYRRPCVCSPYHYRLDWQIWFAAMSNPSEYPWVFNLVWKLLHNDPSTLSLFAGNPFPAGPPRYVRIRLFRYQFAPLSHLNGQWWTRTELGEWLPPLSAEDPRLKRILLEERWL
jgi:hypothetical protein